MKLVELGNGGVSEIMQARSTTTSAQGLVTTVARDNSKGKNGGITGFFQQGYEGTPHAGG